ncbi:MAG: fumarate reductase/succinate dehydrogenase flavoprotein subunit, partial [bacterium]
ADFFEFAEMMCWDALTRDESCGAHFREEHQSAEGEAVRNDKDYAHISCWEFKGDGVKPEMHKEELEFEFVELATRSYK